MAVAASRRRVELLLPPVLAVMGAPLRHVRRDPRSCDSEDCVTVINRFLRPDLRYARRMARIARWDRPITGRLDRLRAWTHMVLADHGVFRLAYLNRHRVSDKVWRAAQPAPHQLAWFASQGVRTIVNLRGGREHGSW